MLHILRDDWPVFKIAASNEQLQQELEYTLLKPDCHSWWIAKMQSDTLEERYAIKLLFDNLAWIEHQFLSGIRDSTKPGSLWGMMRGVGGVRKSIHQTWLAKGLRLRLRLLGWGFKGVQEERPRLFKSGQWHFHQDNAPLHNSILVTDYLTKMCTKTVPQPPFSPNLAPCDFWLFPKLRGCRYETIEDEGHWHGHTRGLPWGIPEVVGTIQVHCKRRRLLRRGLEFYVCTINKNAHKKKVWKLIVCTSYINIQSHPRTIDHWLLVIQNQNGVWKSFKNSGISNKLTCTQNNKKNETNRTRNIIQVIPLHRKTVGTNARRISSQWMKNTLEKSERLQIIK